MKKFLSILSLSMVALVPSFALATPVAAALLIKPAINNSLCILPKGYYIGTSRIAESPQYCAG
ncbi:MAG: hypothetical protein G5703_03110 [Serratia symbiotica]|nr:hypothetical protein [Serratia symbiotica]